MSSSGENSGSVVKVWEMVNDFKNSVHFLNSQ